MAQIRGYYVIQIDSVGRQDLSDDGSMDAYYGYASDDRCITVDGVILRGDRHKAVALAKSFEKAWWKDDATYAYTVRHLETADYFGAYHKEARKFCSKLS